MRNLQCYPMWCTTALSAERGTLRCRDVKGDPTKLRQAETRRAETAGLQREADGPPALLPNPVGPAPRSRVRRSVAIAATAITGRRRNPEETLRLSLVTSFRGLGYDRGVYSAPIRRHACTKSAVGEVLEFRDDLRFDRLEFRVVDKALAEHFLCSS
jgi:hypothetical protein